MQGCTLASSFTLEGSGVHSGRSCRATVRPGAHGLRFVVCGTVIPAVVQNVVDTSMSTTLGVRDARIAMVEHVLSALWGLGVTDATIEVEGPEVPILDGSARPWVAAAERAGLHATDEVVQIALDGPIAVRDGRRSAVYEPGARRRVVVELSERDGLRALGPCRAEFDLDADDYRRDIAWARTFVYAADADRLLAAGYGVGATPENTLLVGPLGTPPAAARGPSEPTRHKLLDAIGDLALLGRPLLGTVTLVDSSHALHVELVRRIAESAGL